ncbi:hypothetical protein DYU05_16225 [Mucilaginibacter terrenus]|uniref:Uncharacterized protein n=1 Tax=Mucilaginibacter terrenus TaxID=2482727 RepID=A0A3E2NMD5_9SPHI|nr:hypothetical protein DYU05_16225 [Mucilaginibacter terrenus]
MSLKYGDCFGLLYNILLNKHIDILAVSCVSVLQSETLVHPVAENYVRALTINSQIAGKV